MLKFRNASANQSQTDAALAAAKQTKTVANRSPFTANMVLSIVPTIDDTNWVSKDEELKDGEERRYFPVFKTLLNGQPFDNIFLKTLVNDLEDVNADVVVIDGSFNLLCKQCFAAATNDLIAMQNIAAQLAGRQIKVNREKKYQTKYGTKRALRFDII